jgi:hypothetical protein
MLRVRVPRHLWHRLLDASESEALSVSELVRQGINDRTSLVLAPRSLTGEKMVLESLSGPGLP